MEAVGFKTKLRDVKDIEGFRRALSEFGSRVIYMTRRNLIKAVVSTINAERRFATEREWNRLPGMAALDPIAISFEKLDGYLNYRLQRDAALSEFIGTLDCPVLKVDYEELLIDESGLCEKICGFLGISAGSGRSRWLKETDDDLRKVLLNYEELRERYKGTVYEDMF
jgi:LPS sulfotransferase NodH